MMRFSPIYRFVVPPYHPSCCLFRWCFDDDLLFFELFPLRCCSSRSKFCTFFCEVIPVEEEKVRETKVESASPAGDSALYANGYHRISPDVLPLSNGSRPILRTWKNDTNVSSRNPNHSLREGKSVRARSALGQADLCSNGEQQLARSSYISHSPTAADNHPLLLASASPTSAYEINNGAMGSAGDIILRWGAKKRSRGPRSECRTSGDEASAHSLKMCKIQRRSSSSAAAAAMLPPTYGGSRTNLRTSLAVRIAAASLVNRSVEDRSSGPPRSEMRSPPSPPEKTQRNGSSDGAMNTSDKQPSDQETGAAAAPAMAIGEKLCLDQLDWPKICVSLSRKEKEDDFLAMKGTKLPQRPKKRAKNIDKTLQYCFPGMWLSDLTRGRYEVREKKCLKKRRRGLKGMESVDSDSE